MKQMLSRLRKWIAVMVAVVMGFGLSSSLSVHAAYENTHVNTGNQATDIVEVAKTQVGYTESGNNYTKYNVWFGSLSGYGYNYAWCQTFVAWCANQAGVSTSVVPRVSGTISGIDFFKSNGTWHNGPYYGASYTPKTGDIIYFYSSASSSKRHVGIVSDCSNGMVYTIEGNSSDKVCTHSYSVSNSKIVGYGVPNYSSNPESAKEGYVMSESEGAGRTIPDGDYWILSALQRNYWLDIPGDEISANATNVEMYLREVNEVPSQYDAWTVTYLDNGYYKISQKGTNLCLDVEDALLYPGTNAWLVNDNGAAAQQWSIIPTETGYKLQSRCNSYVLDVSAGKIENGTNVQVWEDNGQKTQRFGFIPYGTDADRIVEDGTYKIHSKVSEAYCVDVSGEAAKNEYKNNTNVQLWTSDNDDVFEIVYVGDGYYKIREPISGLYVEVINSGNGDHLNNQMNIQLYEGNVSLGQYWKIRENSNGTYTFTSKLSGYNLDLEDGITENGHNISQCFNNNDTPQQWILKSLSVEIVGDCNADGKFSVEDVEILQKWLINKETKLIDWQAADLNADGAVNGLDLAQMRQMLLA